MPTIQRTFAYEKLREARVNLGWSRTQLAFALNYSPSFTLDRYVGLLNEDIPEPACFDHVVASASAYSAHKASVAAVSF